MDNTFIIEHQTLIITVFVIIISLIGFIIYKIYSKDKEKDTKDVAQRIITAATFIVILLVTSIMIIAPLYSKESDLTQAVLVQYDVHVKANNVSLDKTHSYWQNITFRDSKKKDVVLSVRVTDWKNNIVEVELPQVASIDYTLESLKRK